MTVNDYHYLSIISLASSVAHLVILAFAFFVCMKYRRISRSMNLVLAGLVGMLVVPVWSFVGSWTFYPAIGSWAGALIIMLPNLMDSAAWALFAFGLGGMLKDVHHRLSPAKDFPDDLV